HGGEQPVALLGLVPARDVREELGRDGVIGAGHQAHDGGGDAIGRRTRHEADEDRRVARVDERAARDHSTGGGDSRTSRLITPPASPNLRSASCFVRLNFCITIAVLTLPPAAEMSARASSRVTPQTSIRMRSPRSTSFLLIARRSTMRLPYVL